MKQRNLLRRVTSIICAIAMVVTSLTAWDVTKVSADTESVIILKDDEERSQLITGAVRSHSICKICQSGCKE